MSLFFDFEVGPSGRRFRRAVDGDKYDIKTIVTEQSRKLFGDFGVVDIGSLIELSTLSICMIGENNEVLGFLALCDYPNIPGVDPADWETWIRIMFQRFYMSRNTLFIHFMVCEEAVKAFFLEEALVTVFINDLYLNQILLVVTQGCDEDEFEPAVKTKNGYKKYNICVKDGLYLYTFGQPEFCPKLKMRRAVEEDNDDIVEILDKRCQRLTDMYGNYYISEIIGRHSDSNRKIIVAEQQVRAVGVMCLNSDINYKNLEDTYGLHTFHGLKKATPLEKEQAKRENALLSTFGEPIMDGKWGPFETLSKVNVHTHHINDNASDHDQKTKSSKVNFKLLGMRKSMDHVIFDRRMESDDYSEQIFVDSLTEITEGRCSIIDLLEEEPFDYEIVNIDSQLLTVPDAMSFQSIQPILLVARDIVYLALFEGLIIDDIGDKISYFLFSKSGETSIWNNAESKISAMYTKRLSFHSEGLGGMNTKESNTIEYHGEPNAFSIELIGFQDDIHERHAFDLLKAAFEIMKNYDYCIIRVPCKDKVFPLLQHFCFVPTKLNVCCEHALYVAHRNSILGKLRVREAELADVPQIANLLKNLECNETMWTVQNTILNHGQRDQFQAYVFLCGLDIIGVAILEPPEQIDLIRTKYNMDPYHLHKYHFKGQGSGAGFSFIKMVIAYPVFEVHFRFFARELMRLAGSTTLMWLTPYRNKWATYKANTLVASMLPLLPRKTEIIDSTNKKHISHKDTFPFGCWLLDRKMSTVPKVDVNTRIVVVGASRTAMSFLDTILFSDACAYLNFTNVTLVSRHGLPYTRRVETGAEMMFLNYPNAEDKFMKSVPYTYYTNVVHGTMVDINRREKYIKLLNGGIYHYDLLFLLLGKQYQHPKYMKEKYEQEFNSSENKPYVGLNIQDRIGSDESFLTEDIPENVFIVNDITNANYAMKYIKSVFWNDIDYKLIIYGATINAYCCLSSMLKLNIPPECIVFVEPFPSEHSDKTRVPIFNNVYVDQTVQEVLNNLNITVYRSCYFQSWTVDPFDVVTHVEFLSHFKIIKLQCAVFFYFGKLGVNAHAFNAIKKSGLVYDGGLLIDHEFRTKDPYIYAAGPATRYCRKYHADARRLKYFDSYEVGKKLGKQIRNQLDPLFSVKGTKNRKSVWFSQTTFETLSSESQLSNEHSKESPSRNLSGESLSNRKEWVPLLKKPIVKHCILPGGLQYLEVRPPGKKVPHYYVQSLEYNGYVMETFKIGYFKLHMNTDFVVDGITCLSPGHQFLDKFKNLYGLSTTVLNNVHLRYTAKKLDDFYTFFQSQWALYLYHEGVDELFSMTKQLLPKGQRKGDTLKKRVELIAETTESLPDKLQTKVAMKSKLEQSPHMEAITDYVMEWLSENDLLLPVYLQPETQAELGRDLGTNPAFKKKKISVTKCIERTFLK